MFHCAFSVYCVVPCRVVLCFVVLGCVVLCCVVLCCVVLCCVHGVVLPFMCCFIVHFQLYGIADSRRFFYRLC